MKTIYCILWILLGLLFFVVGVLLGGNGVAMAISLLWGIVMCIGLFPLLGKSKKLNPDRK